MIGIILYFIVMMSIACLCLMYLMCPERIIVIFFTKIKLVEGIILQSYNKTLYYTWRFKNPFGGYSAWIYCKTHIGNVTLNEDGTVSGSYIKRWMMLK
jgi:hypothetical protein